MNNDNNTHSFGSFERLVGQSDAINEIRKLTRQVANTRISILIEGESGTGKDVVSQMIHDLSPRRDASFIPVNCGAIPEGLFESEMFGHEKGSFTGADKLHKGYFERADGGTLMLDEIGEMPLSMQVKVLRTLESGEFFRVGGTRPIQVDVRVIAATNRNLFREVKEGNFREDLYYRLRAVEIYIPPLRERVEDIPPLVYRFAEEFSRANNIQRPRILPDAMETLKAQSWKGNVRELKNFIGTLLTLEYDGPIDANSVKRHLPRTYHPEGSSNNLPVLSPLHREELDNELIIHMMMDIRKDVADVKQMLARVLLMNRFPDILPEKASFVESNHEDPYRPTLEEIEEQQIRQVLKDTRGNRRKAAEILGISERTLYRKIKEYNI